MSLNEWGLNEIRLAIKHEKDEAEKAGKPEDAMYGVECYKSAYKAFRSLVLDRHSGLSIRITQKILNRLIDCKPLTVIEDIPEAWKLCEDIHYESKGINEVYQCVRYGSLFKHVYKDGTVKYEDIDRVVIKKANDAEDNITWVDNNKRTYSCGLVQSILDDLFPITMPYIPPDYPYVCYVNEYLTDRKNGYVDTLSFQKVISPDGEQTVIGKYYKVEDDIQEIDIQEFINREDKHYDRLQREYEEKNK